MPHSFLTTPSRRLLHQDSTSSASATRRSVRQRSQAVVPSRQAATSVDVFFLLTGPEFLRDKAIAQKVRSDLTAFLSRTGKMPNRSRGPTSAAALQAPPVEDPDETFEFAPYEAAYETKTAAAATAEEPPPADAVTGRPTKAPARPSLAVLPGPAVQSEGAQGESFLSTSSSSTLPSTISTISSGPVTPSWINPFEAASFPAESFLPESAYTRAPVHFVDPLPVVPPLNEGLPSQTALPMGANVQYGPFATPQWQTDALVAALRSPAKVPRPLNSPLLRLDLPVEQYELIQI